MCAWGGVLAHCWCWHCRQGVGDGPACGLLTREERKAAQRSSWRLAGHAIRGLCCQRPETNGSPAPPVGEIGRRMATARAARRQPPPPGVRSEPREQVVSATAGAQRPQRAGSAGQPTAYDGDHLVQPQGTRWWRRTATAYPSFSSASALQLGRRSPGWALRSDAAQARGMCSRRPWRRGRPSPWCRQQRGQARTPMRWSCRRDWGGGWRKACTCCQSARRPLGACWHFAAAWGRPPQKQQWWRQAVVPLGLSWPTHLQSSSERLRRRWVPSSRRRHGCRRVLRRTARWTSHSMRSTCRPARQGFVHGSPTL